MKKVNQILVPYDKPILLCPICGSKRVYLQIEDLPKNEIAFFKKATERHEFKEGYSIVYCRKCNRDSIVSEIPILN
jgi:hypothetical protein